MTAPWPPQTPARPAVASSISAPPVPTQQRGTQHATIVQPDQAVNHFGPDHKSGRGRWQVAPKNRTEVATSQLSRPQLPRADTPAQPGNHRASPFATCPPAVSGWPASRCPARPAGQRHKGGASRVCRVMQVAQPTRWSSAAEHSENCCNNCVVLPCTTAASSTSLTCNVCTTPFAASVTSLSSCCCCC